MIAFAAQYLFRIFRSGFGVVETARETLEELAMWHNLRLTPEEDAIGDPADVDGEIDDLLPADLWFHLPAGRDAGIKTNTSTGGAD
jgi:hypothetical protein